MNSLKIENIELKAQLEFINILIAKIDELNPNTIKPTVDQLKLMQYQAADKIYKQTGYRVEFA